MTYGDGDGTPFTHQNSDDLTIPIQRSSGRFAEASLHPLYECSVRGSPERQDGHARVLVVDDQALAREAIVATSDHEPGFTVVQAG